MRQIKQILFALLCGVALFSCSKEDNVGEEITSKKPYYLVVNEGQWTKGTAAISVVYDDGSCEYDIFRKVNDRPLGDVAQSISYIKGKYYVVLNNSKKIEVVEPGTFKSVATINYDAQDLNGSPRFMVQLSDNDALVSDLQNQVVKIDLNTNKVVDVVEIDRRIEKMVTVNNKVFGASGSDIFVFDNNNIKTDAIRSVADMEGGVISTAKMIVDKNNKIWALASEFRKCILLCIDPVSEKVVYKYVLPLIPSNSEEYKEGCFTNLSSFARMDSDASRENLYFNVGTLKGAKNDYQVVCKFNINTKELVKYQELEDLGMMYGMGVSPAGEVFVCDCLDYSAQRGYVRKYAKNGEIVSQKVGIYPRMLHFVEYDK